MEVAALKRALESLRTVDRDVFLLWALAELPYVDIAMALGIPIGTVKSRLSRSRRQIRRELEAARLTKSVHHSTRGKPHE
jgi:RNA polymerase sigma-70 factor (ECF subfamily)